MSTDTFHNLFALLSDDPREALQLYQWIYRDLLIFFAGRNADDADDLASETIKRVLESLARGKSVVFPRGGEKAYFFGFAKLVLLEFYRKKPSLTSIDEMADQIPADDPRAPGIVTRIHKQREIRCVRACFTQLPKAEQELLAAYYAESSEEALKASRKQLARQLGITPNALKLRIARLRNKLVDCKANCLKKRSQR